MSTFHVGTFGSEASGSIIGNHNESQHRYIEDARERMNRDVAKLRASGYSDDLPYPCDAANEMVRLKNDAGRMLIVGIW